MIDRPNATPEIKIKGLDLLKEYEAFGSDRLDDEREAEASLLQWDRVLAKVAGLHKAEESLLRERSVRRRLETLLTLHREAEA